MTRALLALTVLLAALLAATTTVQAAATSFEARGSVEQVYVTNLSAGAQVLLQDADGKTLKRQTANSQGGSLFRDVEPGDGYRVRLATGGPASPPLEVLPPRPEPASTTTYNQEIPSDGYGYLTTRDGTKLAYSVHPPGDLANALGYDVPKLPASDGPTPTLIEYSGYAYARPSGPASGIAVVANLMGFTVVDVNMRGTGCSGGAFDFFEPLQNLDGYDVVETVARQPWVKGKPGMFGISYGGISQLFTAQTRPPSLAAILPLSVIDQVQTTLYPGGVLNTGFAVAWALERQEQARPAGPEAGQPYAWERIQQGDKTCEENQVLHGEAKDLLAMIRANDTYRPEVVDPLSPLTFVNKIKVPTFMACQFTDEQTGGHCPTLAAAMTGTDKKWFTFTNGTHVDSLSPEVANRAYDFLKIYVAKEPPAAGAAALKSAAPVLYKEAFGVEGATMPDDPIQREPTLAGAKRLFESQPPVRLLFDNGAGREPGLPYPGWEKFFSAFPPKEAAAQRWFLAPAGKLAAEKPGRPATDRFTWDAGARGLSNFTGPTDSKPDGIWTATPPYAWKYAPPGTSVSYVTEPLARDTVVAGAGRVDLWVRSTSRETDLQATITEVRPDGKETFVQGGWLRGRARRLDSRKSSFLEPVLSLRRKDLRPVPSKRYTRMTIPLYYQAHGYRSGSRIRVRISAPNGDQPIWSFSESKPRGTKPRVTIAYGARRPSALTLPVVRGLEIPTDLPACPALRGQPCREYRPGT